MPNDLDLEVRLRDEDRWLASRFAPADVRARLIALYALNREIARTVDVVSTPGIGAIRLAWWREALTEIAEGNPARAHPTLQAYAAMQRDVRAALHSWEILIETRACDFESAPFREWADVEAYIDNTAGSVMRMALAACGDDQTPLELAAMASRAWGYVALLRAAPAWAARGRSALPREGGAMEEMRERARVAYLLARGLARKNLAAAGFPAVGYVALVPGYLRALGRGRAERPLLARQLRLIAASATGRL
ncbi:MAG TPA: squalene/phytoene synthase family protein [Candidatus Binatia bacterium]|nr:squalene/phytoene synthase family protein [Candidatus Binatia bacterium]